MSIAFLEFLIVLAFIVVVITAILVAVGGESEEGRRR